MTEARFHALCSLTFPFAMWGYWKVLHWIGLSYGLAALWLVFGSLMGVGFLLWLRERRSGAAAEWQDVSWVEVEDPKEIQPPPRSLSAPRDQTPSRPAP